MRRSEKFVLPAEKNMASRDQLRRGVGFSDKTVVTIEASTENKAQVLILSYTAGCMKMLVILQERPLHLVVHVRSVVRQHLLCLVGRVLCERSFHHLHVQLDVDEQLHVGLLPWLLLSYNSVDSILSSGCTNGFLCVNGTGVM